MKRLVAALALVPLLLSPALAARHPHHQPRRTHAHRRGVPVYTKKGLPNVQAQSAVVVDLDTGQELYTKNPDAVRPIASISKLMAMLVVLDHKLDLDGVTTITESDKKIAFGGARSRLLVGLSFTNRDLFHAVLIASDNRAVPALGRAVGLDPTQLVQAMNEKAAALGLLHTHFADPVGLNPLNTSTARDLVTVLRAAIKQPLIKEVTEKAHYVAHPVGHPRWAIEYTNTDMITRNHRWSVITGKTGYTDPALYCLAIAVKLEHTHDVAMVFLGAVGKLTRFADFDRAAQWLLERQWAKAAKSASPVLAAKAPKSLLTVSAPQSTVLVPDKPVPPRK